MCMKALAGLFGGGQRRAQGVAQPTPAAQAVAPVGVDANKPTVEVADDDAPEKVGIGNSLSQNTRTKRAAVPGLGL